MAESLPSRCKVLTQPQAPHPPPPPKRKKKKKRKERCNPFTASQSSSAPHLYHGG